MPTRINTEILIVGTGVSGLLAAIELSKEFNLESTTIALSGGEEYELLFTVKPDKLKDLEKNPDLSIIGHINSNKEMNLVTKSGKNIPIKSMGWKSF